MNTNMNTSTIHTIQLLGKKFHIKCHEDKHNELQKAAAYLDKKMLEVRDGNSTGIEQVTILAALHVCVELLDLQQQKLLFLDSMGRSIRDLNNKIDNVVGQRESE